MWLNTFNQMRKESKMSLDELCEKSGVPKGTLTKITSGVTKAPSLETMKSLVYAMGYTLKDLDEGISNSDTFSSDEKDHIKKYRLLDPYGKEAVDGLLDVEYRRCQGLAATNMRPMIRAAARSGGVTEIEEITLDEVADSENIP